MIDTPPTTASSAMRIGPTGEVSWTPSGRSRRTACSRARSPAPPARAGSVRHNTRAAMPPRVSPAASAAAAMTSGATLEREREADQPREGDAELHDRARPAEHAVELGSPSSKRSVITRPPRSRTIQPSSSSTTARATSPTNRSSWVAAMKQALRRRGARRGSRADPRSRDGPGRTWFIEDQDLGRRTRTHASDSGAARRPTAVRAALPNPSSGRPSRSVRSSSRGSSSSGQAEGDLVLDASGPGTGAPAPGRHNRRGARGRRRRSAGSCRDGPRPWSGRSSPTSSRPRVDLPLPFGPTRAIPLPRRASSVMSRTTGSAAS